MPRLRRSYEAVLVGKYVFRDGKTRKKVLRQVLGMQRMSLKRIEIPFIARGFFLYLVPE